MKLTNCENDTNYRNWQKEIDNLNRTTKSEELELVIYTLPTKESPGLDGYTIEF